MNFLVFENKGENSETSNNGPVIIQNMKHRYKHFDTLLNVALDPNVQIPF